MHFSRAIVTGAGSGLGRAFCIELAQQGTWVCAVDVQLEAAKETVSMIPNAQAFAWPCDVSKLEEVIALRNEVYQRWGNVDLLINNAGVAVGGRVEQISLDDWQWSIGVNLWGVIHGCHTFIPQMRAQKCGTILNVASMAGVVSFPFLGAYNTTKSAIISLSETLHAELQSSGVHVSVLCPMFFKSNLVTPSQGSMSPLQKIILKQMNRSPLQANDIARIALDKLRKRQLYIIPDTQGQWAWRMKRIAPQASQKFFNQLLARALKK